MGSGERKEGGRSCMTVFLERVQLWAGSSGRGAICISSLEHPCTIDETHGGVAVGVVGVERVCCLERHRMTESSNSQLSSVCLRDIT